MMVPTKNQGGPAPPRRRHHLRPIVRRQQQIYLRAEIHSSSPPKQIRPDPRSGTGPSTGNLKERKMPMRMYTELLVVILAVAAMWAAPEEDLHISISLQALQQLDALASQKIQSKDDALAYVRKSVALCALGDLGPIERLESRFAAAELDAATDPNKLVPDEQIAQAFNFMSSEFGVDTRLTAADILQYRSVQAAIFPHIFSGKDTDGNRPIGASVILYQLWYNGGITEGVRNAATLDRPPGSLKIDSAAGRLELNRNPNPTARQYQLAGQSYFGHQSALETRAFIDKLASIIALPK